MKKQSFFTRFFLALILVIAILIVIITTILSYRIVRYSEEELGNSAIGKLLVAENYNSLIAEKLYKDALNLTLVIFQDSVKDLSHFDDIFGDSDSIKAVYKIQKELTNLVGVEDALHSVYLLMDDSDYIITSDHGAVRVSEFQDSAWLKEYEKFKEFEPSSAWLPTRIITNAWDDSGSQFASNRVITFFYSFSPYATSVKGTLIFNIEERAIFNLNNDLRNTDQGYIEIVNSDGRVVSHVEEKQIGTAIKEDYFETIRHSDKREGYLINNSAGMRQLITYYKSDFNGWIYIGCYPMDNLMSKTNTLIRWTLGVSFICLLLGIGISYFISKRLSSPLKKLVQDIWVKKGINISSNNSEMAILSDAFEYMLKEEDRLFSILESNRSSHINGQLMDLFHGKSNQTWNSELTGIHFTNGYFVCVILSIDQHKKFICSYPPEQCDYMKMLILKVCERLMGEMGKFAGMLFEKSKIAMVINFEADGKEDTDSVLEAAAVKIQEELSKIIDNTVSFGIGSNVRELSEVGESFEKAQEALKYKLINGNGSITAWKKISCKENVYHYPYEIEKQIFSMISNGIADKFDSIIDKMLEGIKANEKMQYENVLQIFNQLAVNTVRFLLDKQMNISMILGSDYNIYRILTMKETLDEIKDWLVEMYVKIAEYILKVQFQNKSYINCILEYINKNYRSDIDINVIADHVGLSYSYLRKIFKNETGVNIANYINDLRIMESKRLLCKTNMTVREIALNVGYNNEQSFIRFFKKCESVSPGEFRAAGRLRTSE